MIEVEYPGNLTGRFACRATSQSAALVNYKLESMDFWAKILIGNVSVPERRRSKLSNTAETPVDLLMPGGNPIGTSGSRDDIRELTGTIDDASELFKRLTRGGVVTTPLTYPGEQYTLPGGGTVGLRPKSKSGGPAIDVDIDSIPEIEKIHYV